jgi:hypothetical protein
MNQNINENLATKHNKIKKCPQNHLPLTLVERLSRKGKPADFFNNFRLILKKQTTKKNKNV